MTEKLIKRELYIALHAQTARFRTVKWILIGFITMGLFLWKGLDVVISILLYSTIGALCIHFLFRAKTKGWTRAWGAFKPIRTPFD